MFRMDSWNEWRGEAAQGRPPGPRPKHTLVGKQPVFRSGRSADLGDPTAIAGGPGVPGRTSGEWTRDRGLEGDPQAAPEEGAA